MTIQEMHISFKMKMEGYETLMYMDWHPDEIDYWLNEAQIAFIKERFVGHKQKGFEQSEKRIQDLRHLLVLADITPATILPSAARPNAYYFSLPSDFLFAAEEGVSIQYVGREGEIRVGIVESWGDNYDYTISNPFSEHIWKLGTAKPIRIFIGNQAELTTDGRYVVKKYHLRYVATPAAVSYSLNVSSGINPAFHSEVIEKAVAMAIARIADRGKYQLSINEELKNSQ